MTSLSSRDSGLLLVLGGAALGASIVSLLFFRRERLRNSSSSSSSSRSSSSSSSSSSRSPDATSSSGFGTPRAIKVTSIDSPRASRSPIITKAGTPKFRSTLLDSPFPQKTEAAVVEGEGDVLLRENSDHDLVQMNEGDLLSAINDGTSSGERLILGVAGGTGSGKTTLARAIRKQLQTDISYLSHDNYYKDLRHLSLEERESHNFDHPDALDTDLLFEHLKELKEGRSVDIPTYDFTTHSRTDVTERIEPQQIILVEGILIYTHPELRNEIDVKIFVDTADDVRLIRRMTRDLNERGRSPDSVIHQYMRTVRPMHLKFVEPSKQFADVIIPVGLNQAALDLIIARLRFAAGE